MILTAAFPDDDLAAFEALRKRHFPSPRNFLRAHLTMFHQIDNIRLADIRSTLAALAADVVPATVTTTGIYHLGRGVAFAVASDELNNIRAALRRSFQPWLCPQDLQPWRPHITVQNGVDTKKANLLFDELRKEFEPKTLNMIGYQLWHYQGGPWKLEATYSFSDPAR